MRELGLRSAMIVPLHGARADDRRPHPGRRRVGPPLRRGRPRPGRGPGAAGGARDRQLDALPPRARGGGDPAALAAARVAARGGGSASSRPVTSPRRPGLEVGGDWYEVVRCDDGTVGVTIGDVAGRGIRAASIMGRSARRCAGWSPTGTGRRGDGAARQPDQGGRPARDDDGLPPALRPRDRLRRVRARRPSAGARCGCPTAASRSFAAAAAPPVGILDGVRVPGRHGSRSPPGACCCSTRTA